MTFEGFEAPLLETAARLPDIVPIPLSVEDGAGALEAALQQLNAPGNESVSILVASPSSGDILTFDAEEEQKEVGGFSSVVIGPGVQDEGEVITVTGTKPGIDDGTGGTSGGGYNTGSGGGAGDSGGSSPGTGMPQPPVAKDTPCVETSLTGVSQAAVNNAALRASNAIAARSDDQTYEYSSIIWQLNGSVGSTAPYTDHNPDEVNFLGGISGVPAGAVIVAIVHSHPDDPVMDDRIPSGSGSTSGMDWQAYDKVVNWNRDHNSISDLPKGITVDQNMLLYIYTNQDQKTRVYDKTDKNSTVAACTLQ